jgi:hypothetical protein
MVCGGTRVLLLVEELSQRLLLLWTALQHELHTAERRFICEAALVEFSSCQWMRIASQSGAS